MFKMNGGFMSTTKRLMGWFMLMLITGGCATSHPVAMPGTEFETDAESGSEHPRSVLAGDKVQVVLDDGTKIKGRVLAVAPDSLTLEVEEDQTWRKVPLTTQADRIQSLEKHNSNTGRTVGLIFGVLLGALIVGVAAGESMSVNFGG